MSTKKDKEAIHRILGCLQDCGVSVAVLVFEMKAGDSIKPHILKLGSPMGCMALTEWAASYQHEEAYEGLEVTTWHDDDEDEDEV